MSVWISILWRWWGRRQRVDCLFTMRGKGGEVNLLGSFGDSIRGVKRGKREYGKWES